MRPIRSKYLLDEITLKDKSLIIIPALGKFRSAGIRSLAQLSGCSAIDFIVLVDDKFLNHISRELGIDPSFFKQFQRGYGYWMWKPLLIYFFLKKGSKNIAYFDAGCDFYDFAISNLLGWFFSQEKYDLVLTRTGQSIFNYTKFEVIDEMSSFTPSFFKKVEMLQFGIIFLKNYSKVASIFESAFKLIRSGRSDLFDDIFRSSTHTGFIEHRHDQAVLNLLLHNLKEHNRIGVINSSFTPPIKTSNYYLPLIASRNRTSVPLYWFFYCYNNHKIDSFKIRLFLKIIRIFNMLLQYTLTKYIVSIERLIIRSIRLNYLKDYLDVVYEYPIYIEDDDNL